MSISRVARQSYGSIASNSFNTWIVSSTPAPSGSSIEVYEYDGRTRTFVDRFAGAYQIVMPSNGSDVPWAITDSDPGVVKVWNGFSFVPPPARSGWELRAHSIAVASRASGDHIWDRVLREQ